MDSPDPAKTDTPTAAATVISACATTLSDSPPVQESPFSNYISTLSPINPVVSEHVPRGFLGLSSPPLLFTSPRTVTHRETSFLQRSQLSQIPSLEIPKKDDRSKKLVADHLVDVGESDTYSKRLITDSQRDIDVENTTQDQPGSSSGCIDEYLNDPVEVDCENSVSVVEQNAKQLNDVLQSSISSLNNSKSDDKNHTRTEVDKSLALSKQAEENPQEQTVYGIEPVQVEEEQNGSKHPYNECLNNESDLSVDLDPEKKQCVALVNQANEEYDENIRTTLQGSIQNVAHDLEVSQLQRGLSRRCLQFEEARKKTNANSSTRSSNPTNSVTGSGSLSATELESLDSPHVDLNAYSNKTQIVNLSQLGKSTFPLRCPGKSPMVVSKPSGIGLHLNSVPLPMGGLNAMTINKSIPVTSSHHVDSRSYSAKLSKLVLKVAIGPQDEMIKAKASLADSAVTSESSHTAKPLDNLKQFEHHVTPLNKRNLNSEHADNFEEFSHSSPTRKKRKTSSSIDSDGCKRCNCKKSKCLKLYCDCFAAGIYCAESCACQGCFNRPEYEDTVIEMRQQIESRNPLAFAPKVVQNVTQYAAVSKEDGSGLVPSLVRHKRGCNCKKSMCLKKYCECYQANVGCSSECRCEGCKNVYGRKQEYGMSGEIVSNRVCKERSEGRDEDKQGTVATNKDLSHAKLYDLHNLTPSTPSFQHSDHGKDEPRSQLNSSRYVPSPESDFSVLPSYTRFIRSPGHSNSNDMIPERDKETVDIDSSGQGMDYRVSEMGQFSPRCNAVADTCNLTPQNSSIMTLASSASSNTGDSVSGSRFKLCSGSSRFSSGGSLKWRGSPITPMPRLWETKNQRQDSDSGLYDSLGDDTPDILKEASTPITSVKASSPNKKRVSPPHHHVHGLRSSFSVGLKSGRKFILTAVSSSPSLTTCDKSEGNTDDKFSNE